MYPNAKIYFDGSHYIAIPHTERPSKKRYNEKEEEFVVEETADSVKGHISYCICN